VICGHVSLDKCNVSNTAGKQVKHCCLLRPATYINKQNGGNNWQVYNIDSIFQVCVKIKNVKEKKNTQQATGYAPETV
jgi:hypothetical protein